LGAVQQLDMSIVIATRDNFGLGDEKQSCMRIWGPLPVLRILPILAGNAFPP